MVKYSSLVFSMAVIGQANSLRGEQSQRILQKSAGVCSFYQTSPLVEGDLGYGEITTFRAAVGKVLDGNYATSNCTGVEKMGKKQDPVYAAFTASCPDVYGETMNDWDVSLITDFSSLFRLETTFNEDIGQWDVGNGLNFNEMFFGASKFNQDIGKWDVAKGEDFDLMFFNAYDFNQTLARWTLQPEAKVFIMFAGSAMECLVNEDNLDYYRANQICEAWLYEPKRPQLTVLLKKKDRVCPTVPTVETGGCICNNYDSCSETCNLGAPCA